MTEEQKEIYRDWKDHVNMSRGELARFYDSEEGKKAGLSKSEASKQGIDYGRESARWILKMKDTPVSEWTDNMWRWAKKQINFVNRMSGVKGRLYNEKGEKTRKHLALLIWGHNPEKKARGGKLTKEAERLHKESEQIVQFEPEGFDAFFMKKGGRTLAQTPASPKERIYGSKVNKERSAESKSSAKEIKFSEETIEKLKSKVKEYNAEHKSKVTLDTLKAVYRRGLGAYSSSHRPTISGGRANTRNAWAMARVNKFLEKKAGKPVKKAYVQDDDLLENGGELRYAEGGSVNKVMYFWHGGNLDQYDDVIAQKSGRYEYGAGLYLTTELQVAIKYAKGSRRLYKIGIESGTEISDAFIDYDKIKLFIDKYIIASKKNEVKDRVSKYIDQGKVKASYLNNIILNEKAIKPSNTYHLREFLVQNGVDYELVDNAYGWGETMMVLFNMNKIVDIQIVKQSDAYNMKLKEGGETQSKIALPDVYSSPETLQRVLNNQGYELIKKESKSQEMEQPLSISEVAEIHDVSVESLRDELVEGIKTEMEHISDPEEAKKIALDHLKENPKYYNYLQKMEAQMKADMVDKHFSDIEMKYANGGGIDPVYKFNTPTGEPSKLNYIQQVLVRTTQFKNWYGDWQTAARNFLADNKQNFEKHFEGVSKVLDMATLEPLAVYHGTKSSEEFFEFDVSMDAGVGRPYGYFADNREYSENFLSGRQDAHLYTCFLNIKRPFYAINDNFYGKRESLIFWLTSITINLFNDRYGFTISDLTEYYKLNEDQQEKLTDLVNEVNDALLKYVMDDVYVGNTELPFWMLMSRDKDSIFKRFLMREKYDGIRYAEEFTSKYDIDNPAEFTKAWTIFNSKQVKLADGRNIDFDPMKVDIRMANGGKTDEVKEDVSVAQAPMSRSERMRMEMGLDGTEKFNDGGTVYGDKEHSKDAKDGGYFVGNSHAKGGIKAVNKDTGQIIEVEGNEVIINKRSVADKTKREFEGQMLTNREILSKINEMGGGVKFEKGGNTSEHCACSGKKYKFGGETLEDYIILSRLNQLSETILTPSELAVKYVDDLTSKLYGV